MAGTRLLERLTASDLFLLLWEDYGWCTDIGGLAILDGTSLLDDEGRARADAVRRYLGLWLLPGLPDRQVGAFLKLHHVLADGPTAMAAFGTLPDRRRARPGCTAVERPRRPRRPRPVGACACHSSRT